MQLQHNSLFLWGTITRVYVYISPCKVLNGGKKIRKHSLADSLLNTN